jgi:sialate O-acetylesterase
MPAPHSIRLVTTGSEAAAESRLLQSFQVFQRGAGGVCDLQVRLESSPDADSVRVTVTLPCGSAIELEAEIEPGARQLSLCGLPVGGPYDITVDARRNAVSLTASTYANVLVGDLWVLAGQSNMAGSAPLPSEIPAPVDQANMLNLDGTWIPCALPDHRVFEGETPILHDLLRHKSGFTEEQILEIRAQSRRGPAVGGAGPGFFFARQLTSLTGVPVGLIPCAYGGTSLEEWNPSGRAEGDATLYGQMVNRVAAVGGRVRGLLWYQGESDAFAPPEQGCDTYGERFVAFVDAVRRDFGDPELPVLTVQLARTVIAPGEVAPCWEKVREVQRQLAVAHERIHAVPAVDLELSDGIHVSCPGQARLGARLAWVASRYTAGGRGPQGEIRVERAWWLWSSPR